MNLSKDSLKGLDINVSTLVVKIAIPVTIQSFKNLANEEQSMEIINYLKRQNLVNLNNYVNDFDIN
jgi:hypothetical protein